jgi:hypothetical protein
MPSFVDISRGDGNAGVGVVNVSPNFADIQLVQRNGMIRIYLIISDYNSWGDIYTVEVLLEEEDRTIASFLYKQYETDDSFEKINIFQEFSNNKELLNFDACDVSYSSERSTVEDRCHLNLRFVFAPTYFSQIHIRVTDRAGAMAETVIEYRGEDMMRDQNTLIVPWIDGTVKIVLPPGVLDLFLVAFSCVLAFTVAKKLRIIELMNQVFYEK